MAGQDLIRRSIAAMNAHDAAAYAAGYTDDAVLIDPFYPGPLHGRAAIEQDMAALLTALPDARGRVLSVFEDDGRVATEVEITGCHEGAWVTGDDRLEPTGRQVTIRTCDVVRVDASGRYTHNRRYYDVLGVLGQLGVTP